jgi:hypothetical protein
MRPVRGPPFPMSSCFFFGREDSCQGRRMPAKRTLDSYPPFRTIKTEGKGAGGLRGLVPLAKHEAAPHARASAPSPSQRPTLSLTSPFSETVFCSIFLRTSIAMLPSALCGGGRHHGAHWCSQY